jgi:hypothetical protein
MQKFTRPDKGTLERMTVTSVTSLLNTLQSQRKTVVAPYDTQITFYKKVLAWKKMKNPKITLEMFLSAPTEIDRDAETTS